MVTDAKLNVTNGVLTIELLYLVLGVGVHGLCRPPQPAPWWRPLQVMRLRFGGRWTSLRGVESLDLCPGGIFDNALMVRRSTWWTFRLRLRSDRCECVIHSARGLLWTNDGRGPSKYNSW